VKYRVTGKAYLGFSIDFQSVHNREEFDLINFVAWEKSSELKGQCFKQGSIILVTGNLSVINYETKEVEKRSSIDVVLSSFEFIDSKTDSCGGSR
ncbi:single-stranded DNA-binding protein, partial [Streptobacillus moniliformis]|uniref:single-stranded DNA-binding protein n=1 Tax=Streptobacillus moniliformis TaxID=34105 RepID=UPI0007E38E22